MDCPTPQHYQQCSHNIKLSRGLVETMVSSFDKGSKKISDDDGNASLPATISASQSESLSSSSPGSSSPIIVADSITGIFNNIEEKYNIDDERIIGTGCYATVTECIERSSGQTYAVKSIRKSYAALKDTDIRREVDLLREMEHDNIVRLVDVYEDEEYLHLVTDRFTGGELYDRIIEKKKISGTAGCFPENEAAVILQQVLRALSYLHSHDICHRGEHITTNIFILCPCLNNYLTSFLNLHQISSLKISCLKQTRMIPP